MLTNLPTGRYMHKNIAQLVWPYFSQRTLKTLCYNVIVLPLQKRVSELKGRWLLTQYPNYTDDNLVFLLLEQTSRPLWFLRTGAPAVILSRITSKIQCVSLTACSLFTLSSNAWFQSTLRYLGHGLGLLFSGGWNCCLYNQCVILSLVGTMVLHQLHSWISNFLNYKRATSTCWSCNCLLVSFCRKSCTRVWLNWVRQ